MSIKLSICIPLWNQEDLIVKALDSIPRRPDIEVIVRDDASTDRSLEVAKQYKEDHPNLNLRVYANEKNCGVTGNSNRLLDDISGEYYHFLGNDDYLLTDEYNRVIDMIDGEYDIYYINLRINDGTLVLVDWDSDICPVADTIKLVRRSFAEGLRYREDRVVDGDAIYNKELLDRKPKCKFTGITAYHYNYPRRGSIMDLYFRGIIKK